MEIESYSSLVTTEYRMKHNGKSYLYREWSENGQGSKLIDSEILTDKGQPLNISDERMENLLDLAAEAADSLSQ